MWRGAASAQQQPDRGEDEHLLHHLDTEELLHHLDVEELVHHLDVVELRVHLDVQGQVEKPGCLSAANTNTSSTTSMLQMHRSLRMVADGRCTILFECRLV